MAYTDVQSNEIPEDTQYYSGKLPLGDYNFYLQYDATSAKVVTKCDFPDGIQGATQRQLPQGARMQNWRIDANETEASVYVQAKTQATAIDVNLSDVDSMQYSYHYRGKYWPNIAVWADYPARVHFSGLDAETSSPITLQYYAEKNVYCAGIDLNGESYSPDYGPVTSIGYRDIVPKGHARREVDTEILVARFAINLGDAGGYPGGGDWTQPGDWNPDPTTTLHLTVNGALSGRHNDPLEDPSYSYAPADKSTVKSYGCGGDGGNGGGGGGGASTIIVQQFATNKANYKDILALAKRHGYGSGGGKGGKGGDGCILIYY